jgi:hypothetical protein
VNIEDALLALELNPFDTSLSSALSAIGTAAFAAANARKSAPGWSDLEPQYQAVLQVLDEEVVSSLVGAAFVVAQERISSTVSRLEEVVNSLGTKSPFARSGGGKVARDSLLAFGSDVVDLDAKMSYVASIDAVANYFKHRDEWPASWASITNPLQRRTRDAVERLGLKDSNTLGQNLSVACSRLGISDCRETSLLGHYIHEWRAQARVQLVGCV